MNTINCIFTLLINKNDYNSKKVYYKLIYIKRY